MEPESKFSHERQLTLESVTSCTAQLYNIEQLRAGTYIHKSSTGNFINTANGYYGVQTLANYYKGHNINDLAEHIKSFAQSFFLVLQECQKDRQFFFPALVFLHSHAEKALGTKAAGLLAVENTYADCAEVVKAIQTLRKNIFSLKDELLQSQGQTHVDQDYKIVEYLLESQTQKLVPEQVGITQYALDYTVSFYYNFCRCLSGQWNWHDKIGDYHEGGSIHLGIIPHDSFFYDFMGFMKKEGINVVVCITKRFENNYGTFQAPIKLSAYLEEGIDVYQSPEEDFVTLSVKSLGRITEYMDSKLKAGKKIYTHCKAGRGRSAQVVVAYLVRYKNMTVNEALLHVQTKRIQVSLGSARLAVLEDFAALYQNPTSLSNEFVLI